MGESFRGFEAKAFEAFEPRKWASNVYNVERMAVRDQLRALGAALEPALTVGRTLAWDVTTHAPSVFNGKRVAELVLYFTRTADQQKAMAPLLDSRLSLPEQILDAGEHHRHVTLGARIDQAGVQVGLMMHSTAWLDVMNLLNRCRTPAEAAQFLKMVQSLPADATVRVAPDTIVPAPALTLADLHRLDDSVLNDPFVIFIGRTFAATDPQLGTPQFAGVARQCAEAVAPLWDFIAWRPASNYLQPAAVSAAVAAEAPHAMEIEAGTRVRLVDGVFAGRDGKVTEIDPKGNVRVLVGKVTIRTDVRAIRAV